MVSLALLLAVTVSPAAEASDALEWDAPAACADAATMQQRMDQAGGLGGLDVRGEVTEQGGTWTLALTLELDGMQSTRSVQGRDCTEIEDAAVLLVAEEVDAAQAMAPAEPSAPEVADDPLPPVTATPMVTTAVPAPRRAVGVAPSRSIRLPDTRLPTGLHLGASLGISAGAVPSPGVPFEAVVGWGFPRLRVAARGRYHLAARQSLGEGRSARVHLGVAGVEVCGRPHWAQLEFPLCAQGSLGGSRSAGRGQTRDRSGLWAEAGLDAGLTWHLGPRWALALRLGAAGTLVGTRYVLGENVTFEPAAIHARAVVGFEHTFF